MGRGREPAPKAVLRDPATAAAAGKCVMTRWNKGGGARMVGLPTNSFHPQECGFCEYPVDQLMEALAEFNAWAGLIEPSTLDHPLPLREEIEMFLSLAPADQQALVARRQGYLEEEDEEG